MPHLANSLIARARVRAKREPEPEPEHILFTMKQTIEGVYMVMMIRVIQDDHQFK